MPTALLVHGLSSTSASLWRIRDWLDAAGWTTATASLIGHGGRPAASQYSLARYADDLLAQSPGPWDLVVGHSMGGAAATIAAGAHPEWTRRLVAIDPAWRIAPQLLPAVRESEIGELSLTRDAIAAAHPEWDERDLQAKLEGIRLVADGAVAATFDDNPEWNALASAKAVAAPTLLLTGDPAVFSLLDALDAAEVAAANPRIHHVTVAGAGHSPHRDRPEQTRAALLDWLRG